MCATWKNYKTKADFHSSAKIFATSILAAVPAHLTTTSLQAALAKHTTVHAYLPWAELIFGLIVFLTIYILGAPIIGAVTQSDITALRHMFSNLGIVSKIIYIPLKAAEKTA